MARHKNKHIQAAIDYALEHGWRLKMAGPRATSGASCTAHSGSGQGVLREFFRRPACRRRTLPIFGAQ